MSALTSLLARDQVVPVRKIEEALQKQVVSGGEMSSVLLELDALPENTLAAYCAALYGLLPATRDEVMRVSRDTVRLVPRELAERHRIVPLAVDGRTLLIAMARPLDGEVEEQLGFLLGFDLVTRVVCDVRISAALVHHYGIDAPPRHMRLVDKLRQREPGAVPYVAPPKDGRLEGGKLSELPAKRVSTADWLDADDDDDDDAPSPPRVSASPSSVPEDRGTAPMGYALRRPSSMPPPKVVGGARTAAGPQPPRAREPSAAPTPVRAPSEPASETARALRRLRGPLTAAAGAKLLEQARERDEVLEVFFAFARQFFDYAALFVVHDDVADGRDAFGSGASVEAVRRIAVPLDVPGTFADVRRALQPHVGPLVASDLDAIVLRDLGRDPGTTALVLPISIRGRAVLVLYADRAGDEFVLHDVPELVAFVPRVQGAFEALILRRKRGAGFHRGGGGGGGAEGGGGAHAASGADPDRAALKAAAKSVALSPSLGPARPGRTNGSHDGAAPRAIADDGVEPSGVRALASEAPTATAAPTIPSATSVWEASNGESVGSDRASSDPAPREVASQSSPPARRARRPSSTSLEAAGVLAAEIASAPPAAPRKGSTPALDVAALARAGAPRSRTLQSMLGIPRDAPPPPVAQVSLPPVSEHPPPPAASERPDDVDDEPELTVSHVSGDLDDDDEEDDDDEDDGPPPVPLTRTRSEASRKASRSIPPAGGSYSVRDAAVDVVAPRKRTSTPPVAPERPRSAHASRPDPRAEPAGDTPLTREVINVPAIDARRRDQPESTLRRLHPAPPSSEEMPSVIVDMGDSVNALVVDLTHCGPEDEGAIVDALVRTGEIALPTLAQAFPGPPWFDRRRPYRRLPRGRDVSAIARALVAFRERAVPYVESLLDAGQADRRFYATLVAGELLHPGLVAALADRIFDDDDGTRAASLEILPRFRMFPTEWSESIAQVRRAAKIRGRDVKKRHRAARALGAVRDPGALRLLVELLDDEDTELAEIAHRSLVEITCEDMGTAGRRWAPWLQKNEKRHRIEWLIDALSHSDEAIRTGAGEELKVLTQQYYGYHAASPRKEREVVQQKYRRWWDEEGARLFAS